ncbi:hypothetical protein G6F56_009415 [Rhizopus delemar]|nr:hypothetical protein G6F56_009415 [Rhizopus delemar]
MQQPIQQKNTIDETIARIVSIVEDWEQILPELNALTKEQRLSFTTDGLDPLTVLDPSTHSLAYSFFM